MTASETLNHNDLMHSIIARVATGPHLSKDISFEEARAGMRAVLSGDISDVQAAIFLIALRMKRETMEENAGILQGIIDVVQPLTAQVDELLDISDPYDGWNRGLPVSAFLPAVMAACGMPAITHGLESVGPKYGATHNMVLRAAGKQVNMSSQQAAEQIANPETGWAYLDQSVFCPILHDLIDFRTEIIKRTVITTVEVLVGPIRGRQATHAMVGYVHKAYPPLYADLARQAGFQTAMIIKGVEGSVMPSLTQAAKMFHYYDQGEEQELLMDPATLGIEQAERSVPLPEGIEKVKGGGASDAQSVAVIARQAADAGLAALSGQQGPAYDSLVYAAAVALHHLNRESLQGSAERVRQVLNDGSALARFNAAL
jgi:anthranilate phosphoribosyltransferase